MREPWGAGQVMRRLLAGKSATGRLICHLGPPKTATTAIQQSLQKISSSDVRYLGTFQPRDRNKRNSIYSDLIRLINSDPTHDDINSIQRKIDWELKSGGYLIISEEMFLINQDNAHFEQKLYRIGQVIGQYNCVIVVTLREPVSALKSLYSEIYFRQKTLPKISFEDFLNSDQACVYDYPYLLATLKSSGLDNVRCLSIQQGQHKISLSDFTGFRGHNQQLELTTSNQTEEKFHKQVNALVVPESLKMHLSLGYTQTMEAFAHHSSE
jgi:hypothetical protein